MQISQKKFLLTGGASLIGSHVSDLLLAQGAAEIVLFDNFSLGTPEAIQHLADDPRVRLIRVDDVFCRDEASPCDDRLPLNTGEGFAPATDQPARSDGSHFVPEAAGAVTDVTLRRALTAAG